MALDGVYQHITIGDKTIFWAKISDFFYLKCSILKLINSNFHQLPQIPLTQPKFNENMHNCLTLAEIEAALDGVYQHIAIGEKNDAHINEENCENERPHLSDAAQWENGPR